MVLAGSTLIRFSSPFDWVMMGLCVVCGLVGMRGASRVWSGRHTFLQMHDPPARWPWSAPTWRGYVRTLAVLPVAWWSLVLTVLVGALTPTHQGVGLWIAGALALVTMLLMFVVLPAIVLFARPQGLIPPAVRGRPGAVSEWRHARRGGTASPGAH